MIFEIIAGVIIGGLVLYLVVEAIKNTQKKK